MFKGRSCIQVSGPSANTSHLNRYVSGYVSRHLKPATASEARIENPCESSAFNLARILRKRSWTSVSLIEVHQEPCIRVDKNVPAKSQCRRQQCSAVQAPASCVVSQRTSSLAPLPEVQLPLRAPKSRLYRPDCPQNLLFEDKVAKLKEHFSQITHAEIYQMLTATDGVYDSAYALLHQRMEELHEQDAARQAAEARDHAMALRLEEEECPPAPASDKVDETGWLVTQDPSMKNKLDKLRQWYPNIDFDTLQNVLAAHEGCMQQTKQCLSSQLADTSVPVTPTRKAQSPAFRRAPPAGSLLDPSSGRPNTTPPGFGFPTPAHASACASSRQHRRLTQAGHTDLYTEARQKFREAQAQIATCKQGFHAAVRAGDSRKQQMYTSQIKHWQHVAAEEKQRAQKTIFSSKNADISNTYKLDLHALHIEQALEQIEKTINDLSSFKCTWNVETTITKGAGRHNVLPAVKQYLTDRSVAFWEVPGMLVFKLRPSGSEQLHKMQ
ncbi:hypothetical protein WJX79_006849 [Trebouxia sp. C0005]